MNNNNIINIRGYHLTQIGEEVQEALNKIIALGPATQETAGTMTAEDKQALDTLVRNGIKFHTTAYWDAQVGYIPSEGELIVYSDYATRVIDGQTQNIPSIKIGTGNAYVQDLTFMNELDSERVINHLANNSIHTTPQEKDFWNKKLNVDDSREVVGETLILNRS